MLLTRRPSVNEEFSQWAAESFGVQPDMPFPQTAIDAGLSIWDERLHAMVQIFGASLIWDIGLKRLGYPPTWACTNFEVDAIDAAIRNHLAGEQINGVEFGPEEH